MILSCIAVASASVSELKNDYLPPTSTQAPTTTTTSKPTASLGLSSFESISSPLHPSISTYSSFGVNMQYYAIITGLEFYDSNENGQNFFYIPVSK